MDAYADWRFYTEDYLGAAIAEEPDFQRLALRAGEHIDRLTLGKARAYYALDPLPLRMAACAAAEVLRAQDALLGGPQVARERLDNYSLHYETVSDLELRRRVRGAVSLYLLSTGLLYAGMGGP